MIPRWLIAHLEKTGRWNEDRVSRTVRARQCHDCHRQTYVGLDADRVAGIAVTMPAPVSREGEQLALALGLATYTLRWCMDHLELDLRSQWATRLSPAGTLLPSGAPLHDVVAQHNCSIRWLPTAPVTRIDRYDNSLPPHPPF